MGQTGCLLAVPLLHRRENFYVQLLLSFCLVVRYWSLLHLHGYEMGLCLEGFIIFLLIFIHTLLYAFAVESTSFASVLDDASSIDILKENDCFSLLAEASVHVFAVRLPADSLDFSWHSLVQKKLLSNSIFTLLLRLSLLDEFLQFFFMWYFCHFTLFSRT